MMLNFEDYLLEYEHQTGIKLDLDLMQEIIQDLTLEKIKLKIRRDFKDHELKHLIELLYLIQNTPREESNEPKIIN